MPMNTMEERSFGAADQTVSIVGLGGEGVLRTFGREKEAALVIEEALSQGITYLESARAYSGSEAYYGLVWPKHAHRRNALFQTSKSAMRDEKGALNDLDQTLLNMKLDYLDLWQIHDVRTETDLRMIAESGGALEAFLKAKAAGKVRFIGVTGHHDPRILTRAVKEWPVDSVLMPVNPVETTAGGFVHTTLPTAVAKGVAVIGMKVLGASRFLFPEAGITPEILIRYALSQPVSTIVLGCAGKEEVKVLADAGTQPFKPMPTREQRQIEQIFHPHAKRLAFYRGVF